MRKAAKEGNSCSMVLDDQGKYVLERKQGWCKDLDDTLEAKMTEGENSQEGYETFVSRYMMQVLKDDIAQYGGQEKYHQEVKEMDIEKEMEHLYDEE